MISITLINTVCSSSKRPQKNKGFQRKVGARYTNVDLKICQHLCLHITCGRFHIKVLC